MPLHGIYPAPLSCQSASLRYATTVRCVRPWRRAYSRGIISHGLSCRCDELCLFEALHPAPLARPFSKGLRTGIISHRLSCHCNELCLFEALYPAPLARPFSKGLRTGIISHRLSCRCDELCLFEDSILRLWRGPSPRAYSRGIISYALSCRCDELCLFEALHPAPLARPFSKGLLAGDYLTWTFIPLRRVVPLRGALSCAFGAALLQGPTRGGLSHMGFHTAAANCAYSRHSILRLWRGPSPRAYSREEYSSP